ncbi:hypothetical protein [Chitiniphilus eburneus]|uniref:hypothetical protein n=1 Tax=Chitiniphilus eburneus TaxID=2571148 RepID=UPI0035CF70C9
MFRAASLSLLLLFATLAHAESGVEDVSGFAFIEHASDVQECRSNSFALDRDDCLKNLLNADALQLADQKQSRRIATACKKLASENDAVSGSSIGTWELLCEIDMTRMRLADK